MVVNNEVVIQSLDYPVKLKLKFLKIPFVLKNRDRSKKSIRLKTLYDGLKPLKNNLRYQISLVCPGSMGA